jgi:hypothetical protein
LKLQKTPTAIAIREFLKKFGRGYPWQIWHFLHIETKTSQMSYTSFLSYFKVLEKLNLVVRTDPPKTQPPIPKYRRTGRLKSVPRVWFALNAKSLNSEDWRHPERSLHPQTFRVTGKSRGRPAGSKGKRKKTVEGS